jgi:ATP-dependent protease ClpP protease subunit
METQPIEVRQDFRGPITVSAREALVEQMSAHAGEGVERVVLEISTPGGEVASAMELYDQLQALPLQLVTYAAGEVASVGNLLFLAGDRRLVSPEATFFFHPIKLLRASGSRDVEGLRVERAQLEHRGGSSRSMLELDIGIARLTQEERAVRSVIKSRTRLGDAEIADLLSRNTTVTASYAVAVGMAHEFGPLPSP